MSLAESLLRERMRADFSGLSELKVDAKTGAILLMVSGKMVHFYDNPAQGALPAPPEVSLLLPRAPWHVGILTPEAVGSVGV